MDEPKPRFFDFGEFQLDTLRRRLDRRQEPVALTPKAFDTLLYLVEHRDTVVSKDDLMSAIWPDTAVEENNLGQAISKLRGIFGESPGENRFIATVPGHGYRFVARVRPVLDEEDRTLARAPSEPRNEVAQDPARSRLVLRIAGVVGAAVLLSALAAWHLRREQTVPARGLHGARVAVLPFKPLLLKNRDDALELGMAETLIAKLSHSQDITVLPISAVRRYGSVEQDPIAAGRALNVTAVLDGTIQKVNDRVRVTVRLMSVVDGRTLWTGQFDGKFSDIFAVQDSISERVARELTPLLTSEEKALIGKRYTADTVAYELYLRGRFFWSARTPEGTQKAIEYFQRALDRDPKYALAYAGLADSFRGMPIRSDERPHDAFPKAKEAAVAALRLDPRLPEAYVALGWINYFYDWDWEDAERNFRRALEMNPNDPLARAGLAHVLSTLGRHDEALEEVSRALDLDPLSPYTGAIKAQMLSGAGRHTEAIEALRKVLEISPDFWIAHIILGDNLEHQGRREEALESFRKAQASARSLTQPRSLIGYTYAVMNRRSEAQRTLAELKTIAEQKYVPPYNIALVYQGLRNSDEALQWLERGYGEHDVHMVFLSVDPKWDSLRADRRFSGLMARMNLHPPNSDAR